MFKNVNNELKCQGLHIKMQYAIHKYAPGKEFDLFRLHANTKPLRILINGLVLFSFLTIKPALVFEDCWLFFKCQRQILKLFLQATEGSG